ncbi:MAG: insulinase family protein [Alphaproteobacteria bacterium]|nr:insulinase family protein [Alphaproteobacteria bacterium]
MKYEPSLHKLSNGVAVILDAMDCETTNVRIGFATGSRDEKPEEYGITHFCEHMLCKGTAKRPTRRSITDYLDMYGGLSNASTSSSLLKFEGEIIGDNLDKLIEVLADNLQNSLFDEKSIDLERIVILDELHRAQAKSNRKEADFLSKTLFNSALYSFQTLGTEENIKSFTREQMLDWIKKRLSAKNCTIVVSGKIPSKEALLKQLESSFAFLPTHEVAENKKQTYTPAIAHKIASKGQITSINILIPKRFDFSEKYLFHRFCEHKFKSYLREELYEEIRQKKGLVYGVDVTAWGEEQGVHAITLECSAKDVATVVELIAKTCARAYNEKTLDDKWLDRYEKAGLLGDAKWLDSTDRRCSTLLNKFRDTGELYDFDKTIKISASITAEDVYRVVKGFFDKPISILTYGIDFDGDLREIWKKNFPNCGIAPASVNNKDMQQALDKDLSR